MKNVIASVLLIAVSMGFLSCASTHPGRLAKTVNSTVLPLKVSAQTVESKKDSTFTMIEFTFENVSDSWVKISHSKILISDPSTSKLSIVLGDDLVAWAEASEFQAKKDAYNNGLIQSGLIGIGTVAAVSGRGNSGLGAMGAAAAVGGYSWAASDIIYGSYRTATGVSTKPKSHLYEPMSVPAKMFLRRWVLLNKPKEVSIDTIALEVEDVHGNKGIYNVKL